MNFRHKNYKYQIIDKIDKYITLDNVISSDNWKCYIICYSINCLDTNNPFIQFLLCNNKNENDALLSLPYTTLNQQTPNKIDEILQVINSLIAPLSNQILPEHHPEYIGILHINNKLQNSNSTYYAVVDISKINNLQLRTNDKYTSNLALTSEIINSHKIYDIPICSSVTDLFISEPLLGVLHDIKDNYYNSPDVGYFAGEIVNTKTYSILGPPSFFWGNLKTKYYIMSHNFTDAIASSSIQINDENNIGLVGINRFVYFPQKPFVWTDPPDINDTIIRDILSKHDCIYIQWSPTHNPVTYDIVINNREIINSLSYTILS